MNLCDVTLNRDEYLNKSKERNESNTAARTYNCGGYALRTFSWYTPYTKFEDELDYLEDLYNKIDDSIEVENIMLKRWTDFMLKEMSDLRIIHSFSELNSNEELIAFRGSFIFNRYITDNDIWKADVDFDFHFRVFRDGHWMEKNGYTAIKECENNEDWDYWDYCYDSDIIYFAKQVA